MRYIFSHMGMPVIDSFEIRSSFSVREAGWIFDFFFPGDRLPNRLFLNPPGFEVWPDSGEGAYDPLKIKIGNAKMQFDSDVDATETSSNSLMSYLLALVPTPVTAPRLDYSGEGVGRLFFLAHIQKFDR